MAIPDPIREHILAVNARLRAINATRPHTYAEAIGAVEDLRSRVLSLPRSADRDNFIKIIDSKLEAPLLIKRIEALRGKIGGAIR